MNKFPEGIVKFIEMIDAIQAVRNAMRNYLAGKLRETGLDLTFEMQEVLLTLWQRGNMNQQDIADRLRKNKASLTSLIDNLSARGLVQRTPDVNDRRNKIISLTEAGTACIRQLEPVVNEFYDGFQSGFSIEQIEDATRMLRRLHTKITSG